MINKEEILAAKNTGNLNNLIYLHGLTAASTLDFPLEYEGDELKTSIWFLGCYDAVNNEIKNRELNNYSYQDLLNIKTEQISQQFPDKTTIVRARDFSVLSHTEENLEYQQIGYKIKTLIQENPGEVLLLVCPKTVN